MSHTFKHGDYAFHVDRAAFMQVLEHDTPEIVSTIIISGPSKGTRFKASPEMLTPIRPDDPFLHTILHRPNVKSPLEQFAMVAELLTGLNTRVGLGIEVHENIERVLRELTPPTVSVEPPATQPAGAGESARASAAAVALAMLDILNAVYEQDPSAAHSLACFRTPVVAAIADHPHILVQQIPLADSLPKDYGLGLIGVLNGVLSALRVKQLIASKWSKDKVPKFLGFRLATPPGDDDNS